jgi:hypothetical protein
MFEVITPVMYISLNAFHCYFKFQNCVSCYAGGIPAVSVGEALCITLWYLGNQVSMRDVSDRFNVSKSSVHRILIKVCRAINRNAEQFIKWPKGRKVEDAIEEFEKVAGFPGQ